MKYYNQQKKPELYNQYIDDDVLQKYISRFIDEKVLNEIQPDLIRFGEKCGYIYPKYANESERYKPILEKYDAWGNEINELHTSNSWKYFHDESSIEGLVSLAYNFNNKKYARLYQFIKVYLFGPSSGLYGCPLSMTDGAAYLIRFIENNNPLLMTPSMKEAYNALTSTNPNNFWTSGQWMTEILGGSDVSGSTQTIAEHVEDKFYKLYGLKWFTSAIDSDITFTLAKIRNKDGIIDGKPTLFFLKVRDKEGKLNGINPIRLKDKLGTKQLPTAELILDGAIAEMASPQNKGISFIMNLANITRLHNITTSVAFMRRMLALLEDYSGKRIVFGKHLVNQPLHILTFSEMKFMFEGNFLLMMQLVKMMGKSENLLNYRYNDLLRMLLPIAKIFAGRSSEYLCLEGIQSFGAVGYMENSGIPIILRDTIVTSIWEGSINVLSYDFLKVVKSNDMLNRFLSKISKHVNNLEDILLKDQLIDLIKNLKNYELEIKCARSLAFLFCSLYIVSLIIKYSSNKDLLYFWKLKTYHYYDNLKFQNITKLDSLKDYSFKKMNCNF